MQDPFASAPTADEAQAAPEQPQESVFDAPPAEAPAPAKKAPAKKAAAKATAAPVVAAPSEGKVVLTFKGGTGFDAPWIVIHAEDLDDALDQVTTQGSTLMALMERVQGAGKHFAAQGTPAPSNGGGRGGNTGQRQNAPRQAAQPPADAPPAPGPDWVYKSGKSARGPWQAWMPPQHLKDVEKPVWF
ncbi:hypothetical protein SEA_CHUPACABRA_47 [Mycobacterium phage Chupacabra]|uniref:Uncharacterized protein n=3 Tax=Fromanvirus goose TaxID=1211282 RepID=A0A291AV16_9CAUD|nr:ribonucleoside reductase class II [Mycobacterium phage Goose]AFU20673.1 hypothetical protein GOOSE_48 [Mycobacterium phage Goose]ATE84790.1 hypothetical protein OKCENTRAL2016_47 [Mycobacterium phage OKCentral2016]QHB41230.1 hypothetical protein SEA_CHUPACABRA_47 [Mycobacterium phage Chupacabra]